MHLDQFVLPLVDASFDSECISLGALEIRPEYRKYLSALDAESLLAIQALAMAQVCVLIGMRITDERQEAELPVETYELPYAGPASSARRARCLRRAHEWRERAQQVLSEEEQIDQ